MSLSESVSGGSELTTASASCQVELEKRREVVEFYHPTEGCEAN